MQLAVGVVTVLVSLALGATTAHAVDNDPQAVDATRANLVLNGMTERVFVGLPEELPPVVVDVLAARTPPQGAVPDSGGSSSMPRRRSALSTACPWLTRSMTTIAVL